MKNNQNKPTILRDALALFVISLISILALSYVYEITKEPIAQQAMKKKLEAYQVAYQEASTLKEDAELMQIASEIDLSSLDAKYKNVTIDEVNQAFDANENQIGYIVKISTQGFKDVITMVLGYSLDGTVKGFEVISINDTAGLGNNVSLPDFKNQFINKNVDQFVSTKSGATADNEINAVSGATISTDAVVNAVNAGIRFLKDNSAVLGGGANE